MVSGTQRNRILTVALSALLTISLTSCAAVSNLFGPPKTPPIPKWAYSRKYIKPAGMLPEAIPRAQVFWTNKNHLFVTGRALDNPGVWTRYYARQKGWEARGIVPLWDPITGKSSPLYAGGHPKNENNSVTFQMPNGKILFSSLLGDLRGKAYYDELRLSQGLYNPDTDTSKTIPQKPVSNYSTLYNLVPFKEKEYIHVKYDPAFFRWHDKRKPHLILMAGDFEKNFETVAMDIQTPHHGKLIPTPDKVHFFFVVNSCANPNIPAIGTWDGDLSPCTAIDYIDLKNKTFKTVGSFSDEVVKLRNGKTKGFKQGFGQYAIALNQDQLFAFGGRETKGYDYSVIQVFDLKTGKAKIVDTLPESIRYRLWGPGIEGMVQLSDKSVVIAINNALYLYSHPEHKFFKVDDLIVPRGDYGLVISPDDKVYVAGGWPIRGGDTRLIEMFDYKAYLKNKKAS
jgi:hypothetical protein